MTDEQKPPEPPNEVNVNLGFRPREPRKHRFLDVCAILFACALIGTVFKSGAVFAISGALMVLLYLFTEKRTT